MIPRIIWMYWNNKPTPLITSIINNNLKVLKNWDIRILTDTTIHTYIKDFPLGYEKLAVQKKADWIRLYLIMTYGGIWSDTSIIYNDEQELEKIWKNSVHYDFTGFYKDGKNNDIYEIIESWFFMSKKNGKIVTLWFNEYTKSIKEGFLHYKNRIIKEGTVLNGNNQHPNDTYFIIYYCLLIIADY